MKTIKASALLLLAIFCGKSFALSDDFNKEASISSDSQYIDIGKNVAVYKGNVKITQGSISISADRLEIYNHGNSGLELMVLIGKPASFSQTVDDGTVISAQASEVRFERGTNIIKLNRNAQLTWGKNVVKGELITYDMIRKLLNADGDAKREKQVTNILQPTKKVK